MTAASPSANNHPDLVESVSATMRARNFLRSEIAQKQQVTGDALGMKSARPGHLSTSVKKGLTSPSESCEPLPGDASYGGGMQNPSKPESARPHPNDATDLYVLAKHMVASGEAADPVTLRELLMRECAKMSVELRPNEDAVGKMVLSALRPPVGLEGEPASHQKSQKVIGPEDTEAAVAERLAFKFNGLLRWSRSNATWMEWTDGAYWCPCPDRVPLVLQAEIRRAIASGIQTRTIEPKAAVRLESAAGMRGIAALLAAWPSVWLPNETDPPDLVAVPRGVMKLSAGEWLSHSPSRPITKKCPVDPVTGSPLWTMVESHLRECFGELYPAVHRYLGSALRGFGADRRILWLHGPGGDGKSTLAKILLAALGEYATVVPAEIFGEGAARGAHGHELASGMAGARLAVALEVGQRLDWSRLKSLSGGDEQRTKRLHGRSFTYARPPVLVLISNGTPTPPDRASAERLIVVGLQPPQDPDERLMEAIKTPGKGRDSIAAACLQWLMDGCAEYQEHGLGPVPLHAHAPAGLERWWSDMVALGRIVPGKGWATLHAVRSLLRDIDPKPHDRELAAFLRTMVQAKRFEEARKYQMAIRLTDADA